MQLIEEKQKVLVKYLREKDTYTAKVVKDYGSKLSKRGNYQGLKAILEKQRGKIIGCLVAVNNNVIGWSLINKIDRQWIDRLTINDDFYLNLPEWSQELVDNKPLWSDYNSKEQKEILDKNKRIAYQIAYNRAMIADSMDSDALGDYYLTTPDSIIDEMDRFTERSNKYFK